MKGRLRGQQQVDQLCSADVKGDAVLRRLVAVRVEGQVVAFLDAVLQVARHAPLPMLIRPNCRGKLPPAITRSMAWSYGLLINRLSRSTHCNSIEMIRSDLPSSGTGEPGGRRSLRP